MVAPGDIILASHHAGIRYYSLNASDFISYIDTQDWEILPANLKNRATFNTQIFMAGVHLPHGAIVTNLKAWWYRDDALSTGSCGLKRSDDQENADDMADAGATGTSGFVVVNDSSISNATIDNNTYSYLVRVQLNPNNAVTDIRFIGAVIEYTVAVPLP